MDNKDYRKMNSHMKNRCREKIFSLISTKLFVSTLYKLILSISTILPLLPALSSCTPVVQNVETRISMGHRWESGSLDVFTFNDDRIGSLDSYQHWDSFTGGDIGIRSQNGKKHIFICTNGQRGRQDWAGVNSLASLEGIQIDLREERRERLCMTGETEVMTGSTEIYDIHMRPLVSEVKVNSLRCDFSGKTYEGECLQDVRIYLTNVNARCSITAEGRILPTEIINAGHADYDDIESFLEPDMIYRKLEGSIGKEGMDLGISLLCYPDGSTKESPGTPFTRLVIEGKLDGETFWWPIEINRSEDTDEPGIYRNRQYIFDICLTRKGASDPEDALETEAADINMSIRSWTEKEEYQVVY